MDSQIYDNAISMSLYFTKKKYIENYINIHEEYPSVEVINQIISPDDKIFNEVYNRLYVNDLILSSKNNSSNNVNINNFKSNIVGKWECKDDNSKIKYIEFFDSKTCRFLQKIDDQSINFSNWRRSENSYEVFENTYEIQHIGLNDILIGHYCINNDDAYYCPSSAPWNKGDLPLLSSSKWRTNFIISQLNESELILSNTEDLSIFNKFEKIESFDNNYKDIMQPEYLQAYINDNQIEYVVSNNSEEIISLNIKSNRKWIYEFLDSNGNDYNYYNDVYKFIQPSLGYHDSSWIGNNNLISDGVWNYEITLGHLNETLYYELQKNTGKDRELIIKVYPIDTANLKPIILKIIQKN